MLHVTTLDTSMWHQRVIIVKPLAHHCAAIGAQLVDNDFGSSRVLIGPATGPGTLRVRPLSLDLFVD